MLRQADKRNKSKNRKTGTEVKPLGVKIASILLVFCGFVSLLSLIQMLSPPKLNAAVFLGFFALFAFPIVYGLWIRQKWAFYASLILLETLVIACPLIASVSPHFGIEYNGLCFVSFIAVGIIAVPVLILNKSYFFKSFEFTKHQKGLNLHELIEKLPVFNILYAIFGISLVIRAVLPYPQVFGGEMVMFGSDDPVYHIRLIENELFGNHFPHRIFFDPYTLFPHGDYIHFTPLFDQIPAFFTWLIGLGAPTHTLMETVIAYYPAVLGALVVFPVYYIGKELYNKEVGLVSALLIAILPGLTYRSILGGADHHVAEVLFSTIAMMFLVMALRRAKASGITFEHVAKRDWASLRRPLVYIFLAGFSFGLYALTWVGCVLFVFIVFVAFIAQYIIEHLRRNSTDYLCLVGVPVFLIPLLMIAPFLKYPGMYSSSHVAAMLIGGLMVLLLSAISVIMTRKKIAPYVYPIALLGMGIAILAFLIVLTPSLFASLMGAFGWVKHSTAMQVLGEMHPLTLVNALGQLSTCFYVSLVAFAFVVYGIIKKWRPEETLFLVWSFIILLILGVLFDMLGMFPIIGQQRFMYYYAVNVALLCGLFAVQVTRLILGFISETGKEKKEEKRVKGKQKQAVRQKQKVETKKKEVPAQGFNITRIKKYCTANYVLVVAIVILIVICPIFYPFPFNITKQFPDNMPDNFKYSYYHALRGPSVFHPDWYESLLWMENNTPDPGVDYYELYAGPPYNKTTSKIEDYNYPDSAYGVMSWWDYGHVITLYAHRIPNTNPFQGAVREASEYLIETDESKANEMLDELGTRYVITDFLMVDFMGASYHPKYVMPTWIGKNPNPWLTMEARLHLFDGLETQGEGWFAPRLQQYRLVHESPSYILPYMLIDSETNRLLRWTSYYGNYADAKQQADILYGRLPFSIPAGAWIEDDLDKGVLPEILKNTFNSTGIPLSEDSTVVKEDEDTWTIRDERDKNVFFIEKKEGELNVYLYGLRTEDPNIKARTPEYILPVSFVKTFEYVKGAKIAGTAPDGSVVEISANITTNQGREFVYSATTEVSNGTYEFVVPYSTEGPVAGGTNFDVFASPYKVKAGHIENETVVWGMEKEVNVPEEAVMEGKKIKVDLLS